MITALVAGGRKNRMKFDVIVCDPPWKYNNKKTGGSHKSGSAQKYKTMDYLQIADLHHDFYDIMSENSCAFLWVTNPMLKEGLYILEDWGYEYKTMLTWDKMRYGMGYWFRGQTEHCLFGIKGNVPALRSQFKNLITERLFKHSKKPDVFYYMINKIFEGKKILELFATRERFANWTCLGNEISGNDIVTDLEKLGQRMLEEQIKQEKLSARGGSRLYR